MHDVAIVEATIVLVLVNDTSALQDYRNVSTAIVVLSDVKEIIILVDMDRALYNMSLLWILDKK